MANMSKIKVATERAKMTLRSQILNHQVKIEENKQALAAKRKQLAEMRAVTK